MLTAQAQGIAAGDDDFELRRNFQQIGDKPCAVHEVLKIIQNEQNRVAGKRILEAIQKAAPRFVRNFERVRNLKWDGFAFGECGKIDEIRAAFEFRRQDLGKLHGKRGFARAAKASDSEEAGAFTAYRLLYGAQLLFPPNKRTAQGGQICSNKNSNLTARAAHAKNYKTINWV